LDEQRTLLGGNQILRCYSFREQEIDDLAKLAPQLGADVSKTSAMEITHYQPSRTISITDAPAQYVPENARLGIDIALTP
jgi:hypothetical protein